MSLDGEKLRRNRLELMGFPGYGKNPAYPQDVQRRQQDMPPPINDFGIDLEGPDFRRQYGSALGASRQNDHSEKLHEQSRTIYALIAASAIAIGSLLGNYVLSERLSDAQQTEDNLQHGLQKAFDDNGALYEDYLQERTVRRSAEMRERLQEADIMRLRTELDRVQDVYRERILRSQYPLPQNRDSISGNTNNSGGIGDGERASVNE